MSYDETAPESDPTEAMTDNQQRSIPEESRDESSTDAYADGSVRTEDFDVAAELEKLNSNQKA